MKTLLSFPLWTATLILTSFSIGGFAGEPCQKMDNAKYAEKHQQQAAKMRENVDKMQEDFKKGAFPSDKAATVEELIAVGRQMADLHAQIAASLQKNDTAGAKATFGKLKELETRKTELCKQMGWGPKDGKGHPGKESKKDGATCGSKPSDSCKDSSGKATTQSEEELQKMLGDDKQ